QREGTSHGRRRVRRYRPECFRYTESGTTMTGAFRKDLARRLYGKSTPAKLATILLSSELHCVACYRFGQWVRNLRRRIGPLALPVLVVHRVWNRWCTHMHHCEIDPRAQIGPGLLIMHRTGIIIGP